MNINTKTIAEIVVEEPKAIAVLERWKIDYCCNGQRSVAEACATMTSSFASDATIAPVKLRPLVLPMEHGGWGILLEPLLLGLLVAPSRAGALIALAALFGFLARQPLKLAMQDAIRHRSFTRTSWCWIFAAWFAALAMLSLGLAIAMSGWMFVAPFAIASPLAMVALVYDAKNRSREVLPEIAGAIAMASTAAAIPLASHATVAVAFGAMALIAMRSVPSIVYVRTLLRRRSAWPAIVLHIAAIMIAIFIASPFAVAAFTMLLLRALWGATHDSPQPKTIGWREIVFGAVSVLLFALSF